MVVPNVDLRDLPIERREWLRVIPGSRSALDASAPSTFHKHAPLDVVFQVIVVAGLTQFLGERIVPPLLGVAYLRPRAQGSVDPDAVVVDLVSSSDPATRQRCEPVVVFCFPSSSWDVAREHT